MLHKSLWLKNEGASALGADGEVDAEGEVGVAAQGDALLGEFAQHAIHAQEEIESLGVDVDHPAEGGARRAEAQAGRGLEGAAGGDGGREALFVPAVPALDAGGGEEPEAQAVVGRQLVFGRQVEGGAQHGGLGGARGSSLESVEPLEVVGEIVVLVVDGCAGASAHLHVLESVEDERLARIAGHKSLAPADEAEVEQGGAGLETGHEAVHVPLRSEVQGQAHAVGLDVASIHFVKVYLLVGAAAGVGHGLGLAPGDAGGADFHRGLGVGRPLVLVGQAQAEVVGLDVHASQAHEPFGLGAYAPFFVDLAALAVAQFHPGLGRGTEAAEVVVLVLEVLRDVEEIIGDVDAGVAAHREGDGVVGLACAEAHAGEGEAHVRENLVAPAEGVHRLLRGDAGVKVGDEAASVGVLV